MTRSGACGSRRPGSAAPISFFLAAVCAVAVVRSAGAITFERVYGGGGRDHATSVAQTKDGGYVIIGQAPSLGKNPCLLKTDSEGNVLWAQNIETDAEQYSGFSVAQTRDGGYVTALSYWCCPRQARILVVRTDPLGRRQWARSFGKEGKDYSWGNCVQETRDGGLIVTGGAGLAPYMVKLYGNGDLQWERTYSLGEKNPCRSVHQVPGGFVAAGGRHDMFLMRTSANGDVLWARTYGGGERDEAHWVEPTPDGGYVLTGHTESYGAGARDIYIVKTDSNGRIVWTRTLGTQEAEVGYSVRATADRGYIVVGTTSPVGSDDSDVYLAKIDSSGSPQWTRTYGGSGSDRAFSVDQTSDGGYVFTGYTASCGQGDLDMYLVKTDSLGLVTGADDAAVLSVNTPSEVVVAGTPCTVSGTVQNQSNRCISYSVVAVIEGIYADTIEVAGHAPGTSLHVQLDDWTPQENGPSKCTLTIYADLKGDTDPSNDFAQKHITVR